MIGFFDGASQMDSCGCGIDIKFYSSHLIYGWFGGSEGTKTREKLLLYWGLLLMTSRRNIYSFHVCGDSKFVVHSILGNTLLQLSTLGYWQQRLLQLKSSFNNITFQHVHREYNSVVDSLSKKVVLEPFGKL